MADRQPRILLADDDADIRAILRAHFATFDVELSEANDGEIALETILVERPDLVILDVMMPELNGWEICKYVRQKDDLAEVRVLMLTAIGHTVNELTSPLYGADAYLDKPFDLDELTATAEQVLSTVGLALSR